MKSTELLPAPRSKASCRSLRRHRPSATIQRLEPNQDAKLPNRQDSTLWPVNKIHTRALTADSSKVKLRGFTKLYPNECLQAEAMPRRNLYQGWLQKPVFTDHSEQLLGRLKKRAAKMVQVEELPNFQNEKRAQRRKLFERMHEKWRLSNIRSVDHLIGLQRQASQKKLASIMDTIAEFEMQFVRECSALACL